MSVKLGLVPTEEANETGSQKEIASDCGNESNAIGREKTRKCLDGVAMKGRDPCWEAGIPNKCYHVGNWRQ